MRDLSEFCLSVLAVCLIVLMIAIGLQVLFSAMDINPVTEFQTKLPLVDDAITLNSLLDFQWHLLVIIGLLPIGLVWLANKHVRVDFIFAKLGQKHQSHVDGLGNLLFAVPFFALIIPASWNFMLRAWSSDEGSRNGGLVDLWMIKAVLPLGLMLLAVAIAWETLRLLKAPK